MAAGAEEAEHATRLPAATFDALRSTGLLTAKLPREVGGRDASLVDLYEQMETIARVDGSAAWNGSTMSTSAAWPAARLPDDGVREVLGERSEWPLVAGTFVAFGGGEAETRGRPRWG